MVTHLESEYIVKDHQAPTEGAEILVRSIVPVGKEGETFPLLFWIHGGGEC